MHSVIAVVSRFLARSQGRLVIAAVIMVSLYFIVAFGEQAWKARELETELAERQAAMVELEARRDSLQRQVELYSSERYPLYVEQAARRDLNLAKEGDTVLLVRWLSTPTTTSDPAPEPEAVVPEDPNWRSWFDVVSGD